jgi:hypothetical protein
LTQVFDRVLVHGLRHVLLTRPLRATHRGDAPAPAPGSPLEPGPPPAAGGRAPRSSSPR